MLLHYAARALYHQLLSAGIEIYEYHRSFLHAKVAVVDMRWATVGSSNLDPLSLLLAREANVVVEDPEFASQLRHRLLQAIAQREAGRAEALIAWIGGSHSGVMGLPLFETRALLIASGLIASGLTLG